MKQSLASIAKAQAQGVFDPQTPTHRRRTSINQTCLMALSRNRGWAVHLLESTGILCGRPDGKYGLLPLGTSHLLSNRRLRALTALERCRQPLMMAARICRNPARPAFATYSPSAAPPRSPVKTILCTFQAKSA